MDGRLRLGLNLTGSNVKNDYIPYANSGGFLGGLFLNTIQFNRRSRSPSLIPPREESRDTMNLRA